MPAVPDPLIVTAKAACDEHLNCTKVTTEMVPPAEVPLGSEAGRMLRTPLARAMLTGGRTSDPGYEPPSRTNESSPDCVPVTPTIVPTFEPPGERVGEAGGPFWDVPLADVPPDVMAGREVGTIYEPYAIIKDMRALYTDFVSDVMSATYKLRSSALKWLCRATALTVGSVILSLLLIGALGVVGAVGLFKVLDAAEYRYWAGKPEKYERRERPWSK
jgi:hypothetical protein